MATDTDTQLPPGFTTKLPRGVSQPAQVQPSGLPTGFTSRPPGVASSATPPSDDGSSVDINALAVKYGLDPAIIGRQVKQESGGKQKVVSPKGAIGIMQLMPETAKRLGVDPHNAQQNAEGGIREMQRLLTKYKGDYRKALAAYDAGETHVDKADGVPNIPETQKYVANIMGNTPSIAPSTLPPTAPSVPKQPVDKTGQTKPGSFESGVASGMGFDTTKIQAVARFRSGDKLYPVNHPVTQAYAEVVKQAAKGLGEWMNATAKDPFHITDPLDSMARVLEFHVPKPGGGSWDPFDLHKAGIDESALDEVGKAIRAGDSTKLSHGAGRLVGGLVNIFAGVEAPELAGKLKALPGEAVETLKTANEARNRSVVTAAANNVLQHDAKNVIIPTIVQAVKNTQESIGRRVKNISDADKAASATAGQTGSFTRADVATAIKDSVDAANAQKVPKPGVMQVVKSLSRYKGDLTWEDLKDVRTQVGSAMSGASGKDLATLGKLYENFTNKMASRAKALGKADAWDEYTSTTRDLQKHKNGIIAKLQGADSGLKLYEQLAKDSNKPELNDMFSLLERHGGVPKGFTDELVRTRKPIFELAKRADAGDASGGRLGALLRHPAAAGTAMVGTGLGLSLASPVPITGSFVASLIAAQKAANFMDRFDAVKAMREIRRASPSSRFGGATPFTGGPVAPTQGPPSVGGTNVGGPRATAPTAPQPSAPASLTPTSTPGMSSSTMFSGQPSVGAPAAPASLEGLMERINKVKAEQEATLNRKITKGENVTPKEIDQDKLADAMNAKGLDRTSSNARAEELYNILKSPKNYSIHEVELAQRLHDRMMGPEARRVSIPVEKERRGVSTKVVEKPAPPESTKVAKQTPYEEFGVKIDREKLTTPEAVRAAKADAKAQIEELGRAKYIEAAKLPVGPERTAALAKLKTDVEKASRSVDKMQTPEVSRKQRDVLRKAVDAGKVKPAERSVLEEMSPEQVEQKAASGVTDDEANIMEMVDLGREAESMGGQVLKVYNEIYKKTGGDPRTSLPMLRALMEQVRKAKKPAAD